MSYWLIKTEPEEYSWENLLRDKKAAWTGVRNFSARNNLRAMALGDLCLVYHSTTEKAVVGIARVVKAAYADPTAGEGDWSSVDVVPAFSLKVPVSLAQIKRDPILRDMVIIRQSRLSVAPVTPAEYERVLELGGGQRRLPRRD